MHVIILKAVIEEEEKERKYAYLYATVFVTESQLYC